MIFNRFNNIGKYNISNQRFNTISSQPLDAMNIEV